MMTLSKQSKCTFNCLLEGIKGSKCCIIKVCQYILNSDQLFLYLSFLTHVVREKQEINMNEKSQ